MTKHFIYSLENHSNTWGYIDHDKLEETSIN